MMGLTKMEEPDFTWFGKVYHWERPRIEEPGERPRFGSLRLVRGSRYPDLEQTAEASG